MTTERFTKEEFEAALSVASDSVKPLGLIKGEYCYELKVTEGVSILVRSSVKADGLAASSGQDSIRMWLVSTKTGKPLAKKVDAYTQRVSGWEGRMQQKIEQLKEKAASIKTCPKCGRPLILRNGRYGKFYGCSGYPKCRHTEKYIETEKPQTKQTKATQVSALDILDEVLHKSKKFDFSSYQVAIFDFIKNGIGNAVIEAVAGSGKTTTILEGLKYTPENIRVAFLAFNKKIAKELRLKAPHRVHVSTLHSLGFANINNAFGKNRSIKVDNRKTYWLLLDFLKTKNKAFQEVVKANTSSVTRLVSLLKATMLEPSDSNLVYLVDNYGINVNGDKKQIFEAVKVVFEKSIAQTWQIDFDDMIYFCAAGIVPCAKFDFIFIDEAQDLNQAQIDFVANLSHETTRLIFVGDRYQSIYGFRGADMHAIPNIVERFDAKILPLSISYRCPQSHIQFIKELGLVANIEAFDKNPEGKIERLGERGFYANVKPGNMVLCRTNAPLVAPAFRLLAQGVKAVILGRDIGKNLVSLIEKIEKTKNVNSLSTMLMELENYYVSEFNNLLAQNKKSKAQALQDSVETIEAIAEGCKTVSEVKDKIENIFADESVEAVTFSSVHKAKGGEADTVFVLKPELMPHPMTSDNEDALQQESNIKYVAFSRAKRNLYLVTL